MRKLKDVLVDVRASWAEGGSGLSVTDALKTHREREFRMLVALAVLMVICLGVATWLLVAEGAQTAKAFAGLAGLGGGGCMVAILKSWKDWSRTDLLLILVNEASKAQVATLIDKLIAKL
jgi:mevalonate kinase